jgi:competence protein ComEA
MRNNVVKRYVKICILVVTCFVLAGCEKKESEVVLSPVSGVSGESVSVEPNVKTDISDISDSGTDVNNSTVSNSATYQESVQIDASIIVHVCGAVTIEGVYELPAGSRVVDAVKAAGGFTEDADSAFVNQAAALTDGMKIKIPTVEEVAAGQASEEVASDASATGAMVSDGLSSDNSVNASSTDGLVNINTASKEQLCEIPGIGESRADSIISYRQEHGRFNSIEDIMQVSGIKEKFFTKIKDYITI